MRDSLVCREVSRDGTNQQPLVEGESALKRTVDFNSRVHQNTCVRRLTAGSVIPALLLAVFYAPLFHVHTHPGEAATIHAHLPEFEPAEDESVVHMESPHSHADARSIDILTTTAPQVVQFDATLVSVDAIREVVTPCCGFISLARARAHSPPTLRFQTPRAPPA
jgi:hypothetical protein